MLLVVLVAATVGAWRRWIGRKNLPLVAVWGAGAWAFAMYTVGYYAMPDRMRPIDHMNSFDRLAIAAAMPGSREDALYFVHTAGLTHDDAGLQLGLAIDRFDGDCEDRRLAADGQYEEALAAARRCELGDDDVDLLMTLGRYEEAAIEVDPHRPSPLAIRAFIGAGQWSDAALAAVAVESTLKGQDRASMHCFGLLLASWGGDADASGLLERAPSDECQVMSSVERGVPVALPKEDSSARYLAWSLGADHDFRTIDRGNPRAVPWIVTAGDESDRVHADYVRDLAAMRAIEIGQFDLAAEELAAAPTRNGAELHRELLVDLAVRTGRALPPSNGEYRDRLSVFDESVLRGALASDSEELELITVTSCPLERPIKAAIAGDGGPLAEKLRTCDLFLTSGRPWLLPVFDRVTRNRGELAAVVRHYRATSSFYMSPFEALQDFAVFRDMSSLLGDTEEAAR